MLFTAFVVSVLSSCKDLPSTLRFLFLGPEEYFDVKNSNNTKKHMERNNYLKFHHLERIFIKILRIILSCISLWRYMLLLNIVLYTYIVCIYVFLSRLHVERSTYVYKYVIYIVFHKFQLFTCWFFLTY